MNPWFMGPLHGVLMSYVCVRERYICMYVSVGESVNSDIIEAPALMSPWFMGPLHVVLMSYACA